MSSRFTWRGVIVEVRHEPDWLSTGFDHIEIEAIPRTPLPITETGYRSRFIDPGDLDDYDDAVAFARFWLEAAAKDWDGQLSLL